MFVFTIAKFHFYINVAKPTSVHYAHLYLFLRKSQKLKVTAILLASFKISFPIGRLAIFF